MTRRAVVSSLVVAAVAGGIAWATRDPGGTTPGAVSPVVAPPPQVTGVSPAAEGGGEWRAEPVRVQRVPRFEAVAARVRCPEAVDVGSGVRAPVEAILHRAGDTVEKGDILVRLSPGAWEAERDAARAAGDAKRLAAAEEALGGMEIRAPIAGVVYRVHAELGVMPPRTRTGPGPLVTLFDWRLAVLEGEVTAELASLFAPGNEVILHLHEGVADPVPGTVLSATPAATEGRLALRVALAGPPGVALVPDARATVLASTGEREVLVVPRSALRLTDRTATVRVVPVTGPPVERNVTPGETFPNGHIEIRDGLQRFESVAVPK